MTQKTDYHCLLEPGQSYHLFSRAVGSEKLFLTAENYAYFLLKLQQHVTPVADVYTYSLLPNHFHLLVRIKPVEQIIDQYEGVKLKTYHLLDTNLPDFIMERFSNWLNAYTKAFNKQNQRKGSLFMDYLKRSLAADTEDLVAFVWYIHKNAVHHGLARQIGDWQHDAYQSLLSQAPTRLLRQEVLDLLGGRDGFVAFHQQPVALKKETYQVLEKLDGNLGANLGANL